MEHYVTLFDALFLPQGLALHTSMERFAGDYQLWILAVDEAAYTALASLALPRCRILRLADVETPELQAVKAGRTRGEYCWTLTPFAPRFVFDADPSVARVTYLDSDVWFRASPRPIFQEFERSGMQVMITDHGYASEYDMSETSGKYCVQFMIFNRGGSEPIRRWWADRCIEWCYDRHEDGKFGDQKYLDDWPLRFEGTVHVLQKQECMQAPWNSTRFPYSQAIVFHFQGLRILPGRRLDYGPVCALPKPLLTHVYAVYRRDLAEASDRMQSIGVAVRPQKKAPGPMQIARRLLGGIFQHTWRINRLHIKRY